MDSRPLTADYGAYHALAAAAGYSYARAHGYAYRYVQPLPLNVSALAALPGAGPEVVAQVAARAGAGSKEGAAVWHPLLHQLRAAPWLRVLPAWALATSGDYDWVLYLDSDAHVRNASMSLAEFVASRSSGPGRPPWKGKYGVPPQDAAAIFPPNYPWCCEGMPMTSYVLFRGTGAGGASSAALFAGWHNTDAAEFNFKHAYEVSSAVGRWGLSVWRPANSMPNKPQLPPTLFPSPRAAKRAVGGQAPLQVRHQRAGRVRLGRGRGPGRLRVALGQQRGGRARAAHARAAGAAGRRQRGGVCGRRVRDARGAGRRVAARPARAGGGGRRGARARRPRPLPDAGRGVLAEVRGQATFVTAPPAPFHQAAVNHKLASESRAPI